MRSMLTVVLVCLLVVACGPADEAPPETQAPAQSPAPAEPEVIEPQVVSYQDDVYPIFAEKCVSCHHPTNAVKVILTDVFDPELGMINRPNSWKQSSKPVLVVPGDPDASALMLKITETELELKVEGDPMPWNIPRMTQNELNTLASWIDGGAADDASFPAVARTFGDGVSLGSRGGKCAYCHHSGAGAYQPDLTRVFDPETGAVNVESYRGGIRIVPGDALSSVVYLRCDPDLITPELQPLMPQHYDRLTPDEIATVREWIALGAQNN